MAVFKHSVTIFGSGSGSRKTAIGVLVILAAAILLPGHATNADSRISAVTARILHSANGNGEISPCG
jgi:hypothetical protein